MVKNQEFKMTIQYINTGSGANAGDGDSLRSAFIKVNNNFARFAVLENATIGYTGSFGDTGYTGSSGAYAAIGYTGSAGIPGLLLTVTTTTAFAGVQGQIWFNQVDGRAYIRDNNTWFDLSPSIAPDPSTYLDGLTINGTTISTVDTTASIYVSSDLIPESDNLYDLGSADRQWKSLYVSTNTVYIGGTPLSINANGNLTVNGNPVIGSTRWDATADEPNGCPMFVELNPSHFHAYTQKSHIRLENTGNWDIGSNFHNTGIGSYDGSTLALNALTGSISLNASNNNSWTFGTDGILNFPNNNGQIGQLESPYTGLEFRTGSGADWIGISYGEINDNNTSYFYFDKDGSDYLTANHQAHIQLKNPAHDGHVEWLFGADGTLTTPGDIVLPYGTIGSGTLDGIKLTTDRGTVLFGNTPECVPTLASHFHIMRDDPTTVDLFFGDDLNYVKLPYYSTLTNVGVEINADGYSWQFDKSGVLTLPGGNTRIGNVFGTDGILGSTGTGVGVGSQGIGGYAALQWIDNPEDATSVAAIVVNSPIASTTGTVQIATGLATGPTSDYIWEFGADGTLTIPDDIQDANGSVIRIATTSTAPTRVNGQLWFNTVDGRAYIRYDNTWMDLSPTEVPAPSTYLDGLTISDTTISAIDSTATIIIESGSNMWNFNSTGTLTLPNGSTIGDSEWWSGVPITTARGTIYLGNSPLIGDPSHFHIMKSDQQNIDLFLGDDANFVKLPNAGGVEISSNGSTWAFGADGILQMPPGNETTSGWIQWSHANDDLTNTAGIGFVDHYNIYTGLGLVAPTDTNSAKGIWFGTPTDPTNPFQPETSMVFRGDTLYLPKNGYIKSHDRDYSEYPVIGTTGTSITIQTAITTSTHYNWTFGADGTLTFPDASVQSSAWTGISAFGEGFSLTTSTHKIVTNKLYSTNATQPTQHYRLELDTNGVVILPDQSIINGSTLRGVYGTGELNYTGITIGPNSGNRENTWMYVDAYDAYIATDYANNQYTWKFSSTGTLTVPGNIIPDADSIYSLGSPTRKFKDLYVSTTTIYMGDLVISGSPSTGLTINGNSANSKQTFVGGEGVGPDNCSWIEWAIGTNYLTVRNPGTNFKLIMEGLKTGNTFNAVSPIDLTFTVSSTLWHFDNELTPDNPEYRIGVNETNVSFSGEFIYLLAVPVPERTNALSNGVYSLTLNSTGTVTLPGLLTLPVTTSIPAITTATGTVAVCDGTLWDGGGDGFEHLMIYINDVWTKVV